MTNFFALLIYIGALILAIATWAVPVVFTLMAIKYMFF